MCIQGQLQDKDLSLLTSFINSACDAVLPFHNELQSTTLDFIALVLALLPFVNKVAVGSLFKAR
jgi:hypothetical protein